jgi:hypothetical protein
MIFLTPQRAPEKTLEEHREAAKAEGLTKEDLPLAQETLERVYNAAAKDRPSVKCEYALDEDGREYREVFVHFNSRFTRDGIRWVVAGDIAVNFDALVELICEALSA